MPRPLTHVIALLAASACTGESLEKAPLSLETAPLIQFRLVYNEPGPDRERMEFDGDTLYLDLRAVVSDPDFDAVRPSVRQDGLVLDIDLTLEGARRLEQLTGQNIGQRLASLVDSRVCATPVVRSAVGRADIPLVAGCDLPEDEAERIAEAVRARWPALDGEVE